MIFAVLVSLLFILCLYSARESSPWIVGFLIAFWACVGLVPAISLVLGRRSYLELSKDGFVHRGGLRGETRVQWPEVDKISVRRMRWWPKHVVWRYVNPPKGRAKRFLSLGFDGQWRGGLPGRYGGMKADDLAALMNDLRQRYG